MVVHNQHHIRARRAGGRLRGVLCTEACGEMEGAAGASLAFHPHPTAHQLGQSLRDRQPETGASKATGGRGVALCEGKEQAIKLVGADTDARVGHADVQFYVSRVRRAEWTGIHVQNHASGRRELDGVREQIEQNLSQPRRVAHHHAGNLGSDAMHQLDAFVSCGRRDHIEGVLEEGAQRERFGLQLDTLGLDLREVQNVVDDREQGLAARLNGPDVLLLIGREAASTQQ